jgi:predicted O-methyltransferase YrrM
MIDMKALYAKVLRRFLKQTFSFWERMGIHVTPCHYYEPLPVLRELQDAIWEQEPRQPGFSLNEECQRRFLNEVCAPLKQEYDTFGLRTAEGDCPYFVYNGSFGEIDGDILYCMIRHFQPKRVIEIGSGWSTLLTEYALEKNAALTGRQGEIISIEPYPRALPGAKDRGRTRLIKKPVQEVGLDLFEGLDENDILFIDSSHVSKIGSDVNYEILDILPRLKKGVLVHIHDIFIPYEYPRMWVKDMKIFWNEMYLLQAYLSDNPAYEVMWAGHWMKRKHPDLCAGLFRSEASQSFWIRRTT